jgi:hypothetical protein
VVRAVEPTVTLVMPDQTGEYAGTVPFRAAVWNAVATMYY